MFPVSHSVLCSNALAQYLSKNYSIGEVIHCRLIQRRVSDTYIVQCSTKRYVLRIYRKQWRNMKQVKAELAILDHLNSHACLVPCYVRDGEGESIQALTAPEGERYAVLFEFMEGVSFDERSLDSSTVMEKFGMCSARMHNALDYFSITKDRLDLGLEWMLNSPLKHLEPYLVDQPKYLRDLYRYRDWLTEFLASLNAGAPQFGLIHGDLLPANAMFANASEAEGDVGIIDFDFSGYGWRAYDIAIFIHDNAFLNGANGFVETYLEGYEKIRPISDTEWAIVEALLPIRGIWFLALWAANSQDWGDEFLRDKKVLKKQLDFTRQLIHKLFSRQKKGE